LWLPKAKASQAATAQSAVAESLINRVLEHRGGFMPRGKRNAEAKVRKPLIRIERVFYEKASFKLRTDVLGNIEQYVLYLKEMTGDEPTPDELVDRGMQRLFDSDRGFRQWLQKKAPVNGSAAKAEETIDAPKRMSAAVTPE
jgi:hypothetical protein